MTSKSNPGFRQSPFNAIADSLARVPWDFFGTMTFTCPVPRIAVCYGMAFRFLHEAAKAFGVPQEKLLTALRGEHGETGGRFHFHILIGGTGTQNEKSDCHRLAYIWKQVANGARDDFRAYDCSLAGAAYVTKGLGGDSYELNKYEGAEQVTLSRSCTRYLRKLDQISERHTASNREKTARFKGGLTGVQARQDLKCNGTDCVGTGCSPDNPQ